MGCIIHLIRFLMAGYRINCDEEPNVVGMSIPGFGEYLQKLKDKEECE